MHVAANSGLTLVTEALTEAFGPGFAATSFGSGLTHATSGSSPDETWKGPTTACWHSSKHTAGKMYQGVGAPPC
jgi:hypothetical protein